MLEDKYDIEDLISHSVEQRPIDFEQAFDNLIVNRLQDAINDKKIAIAKQMYGYQDQENNSEE